MAESLDAIIEERDELMISPTGDGNPTFRRGHYLKPYVKPTQGPHFEFPSLFISPKTTNPEVENLPLRVNYKGRRGPQKNWKEWVNSLQSKQRSTWKKAGIYEAILSSTYKVQRDSALIVAVAESWCPETNCFVFPWGAATITLEDMMILGGYSVLGDYFLERLETDDLRKIEDNLAEAHKQLSVAGQVRQGPWLQYFMGTGHELEHEAFLSLWLSRYVFPAYLYDNIGKRCFPIAIRLARGFRIALAPVVLASIYQDLRLLKYHIDVARSKTNENKGGILVLDLWAPFQLAQLWIWERFPTVRPKPNLIKHGEPRVALWHMVKSVNIEKVRLVIDSSGDSFQWRPYAPVLGNWSSSKLYRDEEKWVPIGPNLDIELESFARCLRVSELVGLHCIEQYLPHRVAMQFGMDQDIPGYVPRFNMSQEIAWNNYCRPIIDEKIYIPARLFESDVTTRYLKWWKQSMFAREDRIKYFVRRPRNTRRLPRNYARMEGNHVCVPPGLSMKCQKVDEKESVKEANKIGTLRAPINDENKLAADVKSFSVSYCKSISQSMTYNEAAKNDFLMIPLSKIMKGEGSMGEPRKNLADASVIEVRFPDKPTVLENKNISEQILQASIWKKGGDGADVPPGFPQKFYEVKAGNSVNVDKLTLVKDSKLPKQLTQAFVGKKGVNDADVPPGFPPKNNKVKVNNTIEEDISESEGMRCYGTHVSLDEGPIVGGKRFLGESQSFSASAIVGTLKKEPMMIRPVEKIEGEAAIESLERATEATIKGEGSMGEPRKNLADASVIEVGFPDKPTVLEDKNISEQISQASIWKKGGDGADVPPGFPHKFYKVKAGNSANIDKLTLVKDSTLPKQLTQAFAGKKGENDADVLPPKNNNVKVENTIEEDISESEGNRFYGTHVSLDKGPIVGGMLFLGESQSFSALAIVGALKEEPTMMRPVEKSEDEAAIESFERATEATIKNEAATLVYDGVRINVNERKGNSHHTPEIPVLEFEARISRLEKVVAELQAARFSRAGLKI